MKSEMPKLEVRDNGFFLSGKVTFEQVLPLYRRGVILFESQERIGLDISELTHSDSGILALLSAWKRWCLGRQKTLELQRPPDALRRLMALCGTEDLFLPALG